MSVVYKLKDDELIHGRFHDKGKFSLRFFFLHITSSMSECVPLFVVHHVQVTTER